MEARALPIDGCIHWLTGGPFEQLSRELGILPKVELRTVQTFTTYRTVRSELTVPIGRDFLALRRALEAIAPDDRTEIKRLLTAAENFANVDPGFERPHERKHFGEMIKSVWDLRGEVADLAHVRKKFREYADGHIKTPALRAVPSALAGDELPMIAVLFVLGYLQRGHLSPGWTAPRHSATGKAFSSPRPSHSQSPR